MSLLQIFFIVSGIIIFLLSIDIARRQKFNALHFIVFIFVGAGLLVFSFFPYILDSLGNIFGLQRGADLLVYTSIIFLFYFSLLLLRKVEGNSSDLTKFIREFAIQNGPKEKLHGEIAFVIPAYNEGKVIKDTIENVINHGYKNIIVINDGSRDDTLDVLKEFNDKVIVLTHYKNRGQGAAIETGFEYLRRYGKKVDYICTYDSDGQHDINDLEKFIKILEKNKSIDVVLGSRFITKTNTNVSFSRKIILKLAILFTFFLSNIKLTDAHNGYRVFRNEILDIITLTIDGMGHASEFVDIIATKNLKYMEVPVNIKYTPYSLAKGQKSSNAINIALKFIWNKFFK
nr:DUF2304 family protein [Candidatus Gracilibacteria bacterium]